VLVRVVRPQSTAGGRGSKKIDERLLPKEFYKRPIFSRFGTQRQWMTDAQLKEHYAK